MLKHRPSFPTALVHLCIVLTLAFWFTPFQRVQANPGVLYAAPESQASADCSDWDNACTLQTALSNAVNGDEIWVRMGVHYPGTNRVDTFTLKSGVRVYGGFAGTETSLEQRSWVTNVTVLSGDVDQDDLNTDGNFIAEVSSDIVGSNAYHVVTGSGADNSALLDGFIITAGQAISDDFNYYNGGGMYTWPGSPTLNNITFCGNTAAQAGGGMYNQDASPQLTNIVFSGNSAMDGGGMLNYNSHPLVTDVTFSGNTATNNGGGMHNNWYSAPVLVRVLFDGNHATQNGGGLANAGSNLEPVLQDVIFNNNTAGAGGGGVYNTPGNTTQMGVYTNVIFRGNSAVEGGGMKNESITGPVLTNGLFIDNTATYGGAIYDYRSTVEFIHVTFANNTASIQGGAIYSYWERGLILKNAILWANNAPEGQEIFISFAYPTISYSDVQGCGGSGSGWDSACGTDNGGNIDADPLFVDAANDNLRLGLSSPAIDAGNNEFVLAAVTTDLGGSPRFQDIPTVTDTGSGTPPIADMGAYEADITAPSVVSILRADPNPTHATSVNFAVTFSEGVTGVDVNDFSLTTTGDVSGASVTDVSGGPDAYTVTVATGTGLGTLGLDVPDTATITDMVDNPLDDLPYIDGEVYSVNIYFTYLPTVVKGAP